MRGLKRFVVLIAAVAIGTSLATVLRAQDYPNKPVRLVIGFIPGSAADITARIMMWSGIKRWAEVAIAAELKK